jgi:hypothetical protein
LKLLADKEVVVANIAPMLGAIMGISKTPKGQDKKRAAKPKTYSVQSKKTHRVTKGEGSVTEPVQQHGELASDKAPTLPPSDHRKLLKEDAKRSLRHATDSWVSGHVTTKELQATHDRARHVLSGKRPMDFKGPSGERKMKLR